MSKTKKRVSWFIGAIILICLFLLILFQKLPILFFPMLPFVEFFRRALFVLMLCAIFCLYRVFRGPTAPDRIVAIDILGILVVGFCSLLALPTARGWYIDIGIAWALQSFIGTLALAKYLEGRDFDE